MKTYENVQEQINADFDSYLSDLLKIDGVSRKYFYWSLDFFKTVDNLSFQYFPLTSEQKNEINKLGKNYFRDDSIFFQINKRSHRHDLLIRNIYKLFISSSASKKTSRYEYLKEFILWRVLEELPEKSRVDHGIIKQQRKNYLITYIIFLINNNCIPSVDVFEDYIKYNLTNKGEELMKKLNELDREYIYDSKTGKEIKKTHQNLNPKLRKKIENLYVLKEEELKIQFVFSRNGGGEKEELRELLEIMGKEDTGKLYRGQANSFWNLDASITREPKYLQNEGDMYYDILSLKPDAFKNDITIYERLITMQHYGMPTRLLDVTRNPLVAIFFACNNMERRESDGVIFTFKPEKSKFLNFEDKKLNDLSVLFNREEVDLTDKPSDFLSKIWFVKGVAKNQRINNQSGDFIFVGNGADIKQKLHELPKRSIIIDSDTKKVLIEQLESLNIHGGAVYPDLTHMSNYIRNKYLNEKKAPLIKPTFVAKKTKRTKPIKKSGKIDVKKDSIPSFDFEKIKNKNRSDQVNIFSEFYELDSAGLDKIIKEIGFTEKPPLRDEVIKIMTKKPVLKDRAKLINELIEKIITLFKIIGGE